MKGKKKGREKKTLAMNQKKDHTNMVGGTEKKLR